MSIHGVPGRSDEKYVHCTLDNLPDTDLTADGFHCVATICSLQWRHNDHDGVSNHQPHGCLPKRLLRQIKENIKAPRHWPLCGEFAGVGEISAQRASYAENVSIWWRHHVYVTTVATLPRLAVRATPHRFVYNIRDFGGFLCNPFVMLGGTWWFHKQNLHPV